MFEKSSYSRFWLSGNVLSLSIAAVCLSAAVLLAMARLKLVSLCIGTFDLHDVSLCVGEKGIAGAVVAAVAALALGDREPGSVLTKQIAGYPKDAYAALPRYVQAFANLTKRQTKAAVRASSAGQESAAIEAADKQAADKALDNQSLEKRPDGAIALIDAANLGLPIGRSRASKERAAGKPKSAAQKSPSSNQTKPGEDKPQAKSQANNGVDKPQAKNQAKDGEGKPQATDQAKPGSEKWQSMRRPKPGEEKPKPSDQAKQQRPPEGS